MQHARIRLTQHDLVFGLYWGKENSPNPGLNLWWRGRYIYPRQRQRAVCQPPASPEKELPFDHCVEQTLPMVARQAGKE